MYQKNTFRRTASGVTAGDSSSFKHMKRLQRIWRKTGLTAVATGILTACILAIGPATVWAQEAAEESVGSGKDWALPYFLTIMGIGLGLLVVCHMSRRRDRPKQDQFAE